MSTWLLPACVNDKKDYYYEVDRSLETLKTIFWAQSRPIINIEVGDIVYIYESAPVQAIGWKCKVIAVKATYQDTKSIDESEFEHGDGGISDFYIKITALARYDGDARHKLSYANLCENGLTTRMQGPLRVKGQLFIYINSVKPSVIYDD